MMNRDEFLERLEYLLQDIPEEEKREALDYYRDYLEDAGPENEQKVLEGFGSPEQVASMIRVDLMGGMEQAGEFTDSGFTDERFNRSELPIKAAEKRQTGREIPRYERSDTGKDAHEQKRSGLDKWLKVCIILALLFVASPIIMVVCTALFGGAIGIGGVLLALFVTLAVFTFLGFLLGVMFLFIGLAFLVVDPLLGIALLGVGFICLGAGFLLFICDYLFYGRFLPWCVMGVVNLVSRCFHRGQSGEKKEDRRC